LFYREEIVKTALLGNSDMRITVLGLGAWAIGGDWKYGWGPQNEKDSIDTIHRAMGSGINWIDTAAAYGLGTSEEVVGKAVRGMKKKPYIFTKCSIIWDEQGNVGHSLKADSVRREAEASLKRLGVDVIDLYQIHWPNPDSEVEEGWQTLKELQQEGKVRYIGVSNFNVNQLKRAQQIAPVTSLQPPYSLIAQDVADETFPYCEREHIGVIVYSPMASGLLTGKMTPDHVRALPDTDWRKTNPNFNMPRLARHLKLVALLEEIGNAHGCTPGEVAIAWTLLNSTVTAAIVGMRRPEQVGGVIHAADIALTEDEIQSIEGFCTEHP
jgi:aryl-alcohol dehydrogenase-like predicted oxidoreductase